jgi:hypothetical protein
MDVSNSERSLAHRRFRLTLSYFRLNAAFPGYTARFPSISSMRRSWLYLAVRSPRQALPVLIWPALVATARSLMVESSVSPERCEMTVV